MLRLIIAVSNFKLMLCVCITICNKAFCRLSLCSIWLVLLYNVQHFHCAMIAISFLFDNACLGGHPVYCTSELFSLQTVNGIKTVCLYSARRGRDAGSTWCSWRLWRPVRRQRCVTTDLPICSCSDHSCSCVQLHCFDMFLYAVI